MTTPLENPVLVTCKQDGETLVLVTADDGKVLAICPICGSGGDSKDIIDHSAGLISGILSEEQLINLRQQIQVANKNRF